LQNKTPNQAKREKERQALNAKAKNVKNAKQQLKGGAAVKKPSAPPAAKGNKNPRTAQETIPYKKMFKDGTCRVTDRFFTKTVEYQDINYQLAQNEDKTAIFEGWCDFLNYFDSSIRFQLSFINQAADQQTMEKSIEIPPQDDAFNHVRQEYAEMLQSQLAKGNNGIVKKKYITFGIEADSFKAAKQRLERIELDVINNFKMLGVRTRTLNGHERLELLYNTFHADSKEPFKFSWDWIPQSGMSTHDFIAPTSFDFREKNTFGMGRKHGAASYLQILAPELSDRLLAEYLDIDGDVIVNLHVRSIDQSEAIKMVKRKITDLDSMKIDTQKRASRQGYDYDLMPTDLVTYSDEAKRLLEELQSRNERMFLATIIVTNLADSKGKLENAVFQAGGVAQKYNCSLRRLDFRQEQGLVSSLPLGLNQIPIERGLTTSGVAVFVPFTSQEIMMGGEALYYGRNALSNNMIMADRKKLKTPNGLILGTPGCLAGETKVRLADGGTASFAELVDSGVTEIMAKAYDEITGQIVDTKAVDIRISKRTDKLTTLHLADGSTISCTDTHLFMDDAGEFVCADDMCDGQKLHGGHTVVRVSVKELPEAVPVYDMTVPEHFNFILENGVVVHNSGKSFSAKREITNAFLVTNDSILICDPESEYAPLVETLGGQVIKISPTSKQFINPLDINMNYSEDDNPVVLKSDFVLSFFELIMGGLEPVERTLVDRCVRRVYEPYMTDPRPENIPILEDLYNMLRAQNEDEAQRIATALEIYVTGSLNVFNNRTNIDLTSRIVCFDIRELGKSLRKIAMLIVQDQVWNRVTVNRFEKGGRATRYYIDEFHLLFKDPQTASYSAEIWKRFRKWGGIPTGITQNVKELLLSEEIENIFDNSDFIYMLNQAPGDRQRLAKQLNISPHQLSYVTNSNEGEGLIYFGNVIIPFIDQFPKDTELYRIMTTKIDEVNAPTEGNSA